MKEHVKLSKLQKQILRLALDNKVRENRRFGKHDSADVLSSEILATIYTFPLERPLRDHEGKRTHERNFNRDVIGKARYNAAHAAVSRAMLRLESRGLVERVWAAHSRWSGSNLTREGFKIAQMVKAHMFKA